MKTVESDLGDIRGKDVKNVCDQYDTGLHHNLEVFTYFLQCSCPYPRNYHKEYNLEYVLRLCMSHSLWSKSKERKYMVEDGKDVGEEVGFPHYPCYCVFVPESNY